MIFDVHPVRLIAVVGVVLAVVAAVTAWRTRSRGFRVLLLVLTLVYLLPAAGVILVVHPELIDDRFRTYKAFYCAIETGMTTNQVFGILDHYYPKSGRRQPPKMMHEQPENLFFSMNPEGSREPDCETIFLKLEGDRVKSKDYIPD